MGQYHQVYNLTKKETFTTRALNSGPKLLEWSIGGAYAAGLAVLLCNSNGRGGGDLNIYAPLKKDENGQYVRDAHGSVMYDYTPEQMLQMKILSMAAGRWAGDKIVVQGDYAEKGDPGFISAARRAKFTDISDLVREALSVDLHLRSLMQDDEG